MGDDFKTILLSFPLYYLDTSDAHDLLGYVMRNKFGNPLSIPESNEPGRLDVRAFPNPSSGLVEVFLPDIQAQCTLSLFTLSGQEVLYQDLPAPATRIDISHLPVGMYLMKVSSNHGVQVIKLIKE
jgi:hypothetical protein